MKKIRIFLFPTIISLLITGCGGGGYWIKSTFTGSLRKIGATKYDLHPKKVRTGPDGSVAIETDLLVDRKGKEREVVQSYVFGSEKMVRRSYKKGKSSLVSINGAEGIKASKIKIRVVDLQDKGWHLLTPGRNLKGALSSDLPDELSASPNIYDVDDYFPIQLKGKQRALMIREIKLDKKLKCVPGDRIYLTQVLLFVPALALDIAFLPIKVFVYMTTVGGGRGF